MPLVALALMPSLHLLAGVRLGKRPTSVDTTRESVLIYSGIVVVSGC